jgi:hypothetical protein
MVGANAQSLKFLPQDWYSTVPWPEAAVAILSRECHIDYVLPNMAQSMGRETAKGRERRAVGSNPSGFQKDGL